MRNQKGGALGIWLCIAGIILALTAYFIFITYSLSDTCIKVQKKGLKTCIEEIWYGEDYRKEVEYFIEEEKF